MENRTNTNGTDRSFPLQITLLDADFEEHYGRHKYYVKCIIDGKIVKSQRSEKGVKPHWGEVKVINVHESSEFELRVYMYHRLWWDKVIGSIKETVSILCNKYPEGKDITIELKHPTSQIPLSGKIRFQLRFDKVESIEEAEKVVEHVDAAPESTNQHYHEKIENDAKAILEEVRRRPPLSDKWKSILGHLKPIVEVFGMSSLKDQYTNMALNIMLAVPQAFIDELDTEEKLGKLIDIMDDTYICISDAKFLNSAKKFEKHYYLVMRQTVECGHFIIEYSKRNFARRAINILNSAQDIIQEHADAFSRIRSNFLLDGVVHTAITSVKILDKVDEVGEMMILNSLKHSDGMGFNSDLCCLPTTRGQILEQITSWINRTSGNPDDLRRVLLLTGLAGSGKSAIAHTICQTFYDGQRLGSSFFCSREKQDSSRPVNVFRTIGWDLANWDVQIKRKLISEIQSNKALCATESIMEQLERFVLKPAADLTIVGPVLIVVDALDECGEAESREKMLRMFMEKVKELPENFRFFFTARDGESDIDGLFQNEHVLHISMQDIDADSNRTDISAYVNDTLGAFQDELSEVSENWRQDLTTEADGLFIWISAACRFIRGSGKGGSDPNSQLRKILDPSTQHLTPGMSSLYLKILRNKFDENDKKSLALLKTILGTLLVAFRSLSTEMLSEFCNQKTDVIFRSYISHLASLYRGTDSPDAYLQSIHRSFLDFLTEKEYSGPYHIFPEENHYRMAQVCLTLLNDNLKTNSCSLTDVFLTRDNIPHSAIDNNIGEHLRYACQYWHWHLSCMADAKNIRGRLQTFLYQHLLHWFEVMSILGMMNEARDALMVMSTWLNKRMPEESTMINLTYDGIQFLQLFSVPVSVAPLQTYISALFFTPSETKLYKTYSSTILRSSTFCAGQEKAWSSLEARLSEYTNTVDIITFSPDGRLIACGSANDLCLWDAFADTWTKPKPVLESKITSVTFSPDGSYLAAATMSGGIHFWRMSNLHSEYLSWKISNPNSIALVFPTNQMLLASSFTNDTMLLWKIDVESRVVHPCSLACNIGSLFKVFFSPDGNIIASVSRDNKISLWSTDAQIRRWSLDIGKPEGPEDLCSVIAISRDNKTLAFGTEDGSVQLWDIEAQAINWKRKGMHHPSQLRAAGMVRTIAFSPDGQQIVSGTVPNLEGSLACRNVLLWDSKTGAAYEPSLSGPVNAVYAASFSPDGIHMVTGHGLDVVTGKCDANVWNFDGGICSAKCNVVESDSEIQSPVPNDNAPALVLSSDGGLLAGQVTKGALIIWDVDSGKKRYQNKQARNTWFKTLVFSPNSKQLAGCGFDGSVWWWRLSNKAITGKQVYVGQQGNAKTTSVEFSADGMRLNIRAVAKEVIWDVTDPLQIRKISSNTYNTAAEQQGGSFDVDNSGLDTSQSTHSKISGGWLLSSTGKKLWWLPPQFRGRRFDQKNISVIYNSNSVIIFKDLELQFGLTV